ncbi:Hypothetical protein R9X50_00581000 [Acrodontium crateriforme]|uniref:Uncharacterized protein n=1 Tax=Acrodontium crateriforme TaxID=150365 RepID=A0AAQ3RBT1_9PEZI|nr:Hypothetical protein R9X50_00581000 [Acrodontium crateriforme]
MTPAIDQVHLFNSGGDDGDDITPDPKLFISTHLFPTSLFPPTSIAKQLHPILSNQTPIMPDQELSPEDKKILEEAHKNKENPEHPAHKDHPKHHEFLKSIPKKLGGAAIFGAGATAGSDLVNSIVN